MNLVRNSHFESLQSQTLARLRRGFVLTASRRTVRPACRSTYSTQAGILDSTFAESGFFIRHASSLGGTCPLVF